jgi:hypothetical protein
MTIRLATEAVPILGGCGEVKEHTEESPRR